MESFDEYVLLLFDTYTGSYSCPRERFSDVQTNKTTTKLPNIVTAVFKAHFDSYPLLCARTERVSHEDLTFCMDMMYLHVVSIDKKI